MCHPITTSADHNVITNATKILTISSKRQMPAEPSAKTHVQGRALELDIMYDSVMLNEIENMDAYEEHMAAYVALCIEENLLNKIKQFKYKCSGCASILLNSNDRINDELLAKKTIQIG